MKRSDAIKRMVYFWSQLNDPKSEYSIDLSLETKMNFLLEGLEGAGMLPPQIPILKIYDITIKSENKWEPEDA